MAKVGFADNFDSHCLVSVLEILINGVILFDFSRL